MSEDGVHNRFERLVQRMAGPTIWTATSSIPPPHLFGATDILAATASIASANFSGNATDITAVKADAYSTFQAVALTLVLGCIIIGTVIGNILVCVAVCLVKKLRRPYNYLIVSLAVSDLCVALLVMPLATAYEILGVWTFGPIMCNVWVSFDVLSCTASILNLCMISIDRYHAITKPLQYCVQRTPKRMLFCVAIVWGLAGCVSLPALLIIGNKHEIEKDGTRTTECIVCQNPGYQIYATLASFYLPLTVMLVVYYKIFCAARRIVLKERQSRSHMEAHCYLEISVRNGGTQVGAESPAPYATKQPHHHHHRSSTTSTITTCSGQTNISTRCFPRSSNESQTSQMLPPTPAQPAPPNPVQTPVQAQDSLTPKPSRNNNRLQSFCARKSTAALIGTPSQKRIRFQLAKERKASTTLGIIMTAFTVCWLPFFVLALVRPFLEEDQQESIKSLSSVFLWLGYANSLLNPIIYATLNRDFRKPFQQILFFKCSSLNDMMREEFYHSQYGDPEYTVVNSSHVPQGERSVETVQAAANESFL